MPTLQQVQGGERRLRSPARKRGWLVGAGVGLLTLAGMGTGIAAGNAFHELIGAVFFVFAWLPVVVVHELGHAVAAQLVGWRVGIFHVAPWTLRLKPLSLRFDGALGGPDIAGFVLPWPRQAKHDTWRRSACISAGGPIASWLLAAACFLLATPGIDVHRLGIDAAVPFAAERGRPFVEWHQDALRAFALGFGALSSAVGLLTSVPTALRSGWANDAAQVAGLVAQRPAHPALSRVKDIALALRNYNVPPHTLEPWLIEALNREGAKRALFVKFLDALLGADASGLRGAAASLAQAHPKTSEALVACGLVAAWLDGDATSADDCLAAARDLRDVDVLVVRNFALATVLRLKGEADASEDKLKSIFQMRPAWREAFLRAGAAALRTGAETPL